MGSLIGHYAKVVSSPSIAAFLEPTQLAYFTTYGGLALGLRLVDQAAESASFFKTAPWSAVSIRALRSHGDKALGETRRILHGQRAVVKLSGHSEAFSAYASRGANTSSSRETLLVDQDLSAQNLLALFSSSELGASASIVLQGFVPDAAGYATIVHTEGDSVTAEISSNAERFLFEYRADVLRHRESTLQHRGVGPLAALPVERLAEAHSDLHARLGFDLNTEGFFDGSSYTVIQLRPTPGDQVIDVALSLRVQELIRERSAAETRFAWGAFLYEGILAPMASAAPIVAVTRDYRLPEADARLVAQEFYPSVVDWASSRLAGESLPHAAWADQSLMRCVAAPILFDLRTGFALSHEIHLLPPPGRYRARLRYVGAPWLCPNDVLGRRCVVASDGHTAAIVLE